MPTVDYEPHLLEDLKDLEYAAGFLTAALEEGEDIFLAALSKVAKAQGSMTAPSEAINLDRENLHYMLSTQGSPRLSSLTSVLDKLGIEIKFSPKLHGTKAA